MKWIPNPTAFSLFLLNFTLLEDRGISRRTYSTLGSTVESNSDSLQRLKIRRKEFSKNDSREGGGKQQSDLSVVPC
jgi:hypothetical protein